MKVQRSLLVVSAVVVWFASCFSLPLKVHLYFVLMSPKALSDGQYAMIFPFAIALGIVSGLVPAALTVILTKRKPKFDRVAILVALGYAAFGATVTTACEAIFVGKNWLGGGVLATLGFLTIGLPVSLLAIAFLAIFPPNLLSGTIALLPLMSALLIAFYFTNPRGWKSETVADQRTWDSAGDLPS